MFGWLPFQCSMAVYFHDNWHRHWSMTVWRSVYSSGILTMTRIWNKGEIILQQNQLSLSQMLQDHMNESLKWNKKTMKKLIKSDAKPFCELRFQIYISIHRYMSKGLMKCLSVKLRVPTDHYWEAPYYSSKVFFNFFFLLRSPWNRDRKLKFFPLGFLPPCATSPAWSARWGFCSARTEHSWAADKTSI